mmetsp:Transcript_32335/g.99665  ORF Transcript_32335/g.99665 Transcript_32335/m.99665 type:complete len:284 (-) Transcript_32335:3-854(-)
MCGISSFSPRYRRSSNQPTLSARLYSMTSRSQRSCTKRSAFESAWAAARFSMAAPNTSRRAARTWSAPMARAHKAVWKWYDRSSGGCVQSQAASVSSETKRPRHDGSAPHVYCNGASADEPSARGPCSPATTIAVRPEAGRGGRIPRRYSREIGQNFCASSAAGASPTQTDASSHFDSKNTRASVAACATVAHHKLPLTRAWWPAPRPIYQTPPPGGSKVLMRRSSSRLSRSSSGASTQRSHARTCLSRGGESSRQRFRESAPPASAEASASAPSASVTMHVA